nr:ORF2 [Tick-associated anellovirus 5]
MGRPQEEWWLMSIDLSHKTWCPCEDYRRHIPGWSDTTTGDAGGRDAALTEDIAVHFDLDFVDEPTLEDVDR